MKQRYLIYFLTALNVLLIMTGQSGYCQTVQAPDTTMGDYHEVIGQALIKCEYEMAESVRKDSIISVQEEIIRKTEELVGLKDGVIEELARKLSEKPPVILEHDWVTTGVLTGLTAVVSVVLYFTVLK